MNVSHSSSLNYILFFLEKYIPLFRMPVIIYDKYDRGPPC